MTLDLNDKKKAFEYFKKALYEYQETMIRGLLEYDHRCYLASYYTHIEFLINYIRNFPDKEASEIIMKRIRSYINDEKDSVKTEEENDVH